jgi:hypothetical protein
MDAEQVRQMLVGMLNGAPEHLVVQEWILARCGPNGLPAVRALKDVLVGADTATLNALLAAYQREGGT